MYKTFNICEDNIEKLEKKLATIKKKCDKAQVPFHYRREYEFWDKVTLDNGETINVKFIAVSAEGTLIRSGWQFVANLEHTPNGNLVKGFWDDRALPAYYFRCDLACDHCKVKRYRRYATLVRNAETGEYKLLGTNCVQEYTNGLNAELIAAMMSGYKALEDSQNNVGTPHSKWYDVNEYLSHLVTIIDKYGFVSSGKDVDGFIPTRVRLMSEELDEVYSKAVLEESQAIKQYYRNMKPLTDFDITMASIFISGYFNRSTIGYFCYAVSSYRKHI